MPTPTTGRGGRAALAVAVLALVLAMSGGAFAAGHYLITSTKQISPKVLKSLRGKRGPAGAAGARGATGATGAQGAPGATGAQGPAGANGTNGVGPAYAVTNLVGASTSSTTDMSFHSIATLPIPAAGDFVASAKVVVAAFGGSGEAGVLCKLVAADASGPATPAEDDDEVFMTSTPTGWMMMPLQLTYSFSGPGTIQLSCEQSGGSGANESWSEAAVSAIQVTSLTSAAVGS